MEKSFDDTLHLATIAKFNVDGRDVGGYILRREVGSSLLQQQRWQIVFVFESQGIHPWDIEEQMETARMQVESALKEFPKGETITFHFSTFAGDLAQQQQLSALVDNASEDTQRLIIASEQARVQQLAREGNRKIVRLRIYCTYTVGNQSHFSGDKDIVEKFLASLETSLDKFLKTISGNVGEYSNKELWAMLLSAYREGFGRYERLLSKMGLPIKALTADEVWKILWERFNRTEPITIPQLLLITQSGLKELFSSQLDAKVLLTRDGGVPEAHTSYVKVRAAYVAPLIFMDKPDGWQSSHAQLCYLWEALSRDAVRDTECFCQLSYGDAQQSKLKLEFTTKQASYAAAKAEESGNIDVGSELVRQEVIEAQAAILEGGQPIYAATVFLIHRPSLKELNEACLEFSSYFTRPAWVARDDRTAWIIWRQTLPVVLDHLLKHAALFDKRTIYLTTEVAGVIPLVKPHPCDAEGVEFLTEEGGFPIHLDLFSKQRHVGIFATTRSGKSVLLSGIFIHALVRGIPVVAVDYPKPDGTSSFEVFTKLVGGSYFDITKEKSNLLEIPDLRNFSPSQRKERLSNFRGFLLIALITMIVGANKRKELPVSVEVIESILKLALSKFFQDDSIINRYERAFVEGISSHAWQNIPTLSDFILFCRAESLNLSQIGTQSKQALEFIELRLASWVQSPGLGESISQPSTFRSDAPLLVFALTNLGDDNEAAVIALSVYLAALRRAFASETSLVVVDEAPVLFQFDSISNLIGRLFATGAGAGMKVVLTGQDPDTIKSSKAGEQIFQNMSTKMVGRIQNSAVGSFEKIFGYPRELISKNASESFFPKREGIYSQWLLDNNGKFTFCRYYPPLILLALVASNPDEQIARAKVLNLYPHDQLKAIAEFSQLLKLSIQSGTSIKQVVDDKISGL
ncbi:MAG: hypothetical protein F6K47_04000 [Symploca sp. SIO2E6]|nr:hypothetical protein [Symploca sp. SIO2E6]